MPAHCSNCGFENPTDFAFCGRCGTRLADPPAGATADEKQATISRLKEAGDLAKQHADLASALAKYHEALSLLDSTLMKSDATLHVQFVKQRFDILAERYPLWASAGQPDRVEPDLQEMLVLARRSGDGARLSKSMTWLARFYLTQGRHEPARPLLEETVSLLRSQGDRPGEARAQTELAKVNWRMGKFDSVANSLQRAHELCRGLGEPAGLARSYFDLGLLYRDGLSQPYHAANHFEKALEYARLAGDHQLETRALIATGMSWTRLGDYVHARAALDQAEHTIDRTRSTDVLVWLTVALADVARETRAAEAPDLAARAVALAAEQRFPDLEWCALTSQTQIAQAMHHWHDTPALLRRMAEIESSGVLHAYCAIWRNTLLARAQLHLDDADAARDASARAVSALEKHGLAGVPVPQAILWTRFEVASRSRDPSAIHYLRQAREAMLSQANTIGDSGLRSHFLRDVTIHRAIGDDWAKVHA